MEGKRFLVTGASGGLGSKVAAALAARGAVVFAADLKARLAADPSARFTAGAPAGRDRVIPLAMDVTDGASVARARKLIGPGPIDGVVCAAGVFAGGPLVEMNEEEIRKTFDVNVMGAFRVIRELFPLLRAGRGRVVLVSSESAWPVMPFTGPYAMSKCALEAFAHSLRREVSILGVGVSLIRPGAIRTPFLDSARVAFSRSGGSSPFAAAHATALRMLGREQDTAMDPRRVALVCVRALTRRRPRPSYRVGNDPLRSFLGVFPHSATDWLIRRFLMPRTR
jgi:NAD(P)-dependent dehydrogenase (short-subunit alcohol dehydrogenase family)